MLLPELAAFSNRGVLTTIRSRFIVSATVNKNLSAYIRHLIEDDVNDGLKLDVEHGGKRAKTEVDLPNKDE